jgi:hypothetical protein
LALSSPAQSLPFRCESPDKPAHCYQVCE